jgi:hypothetical protein
MKKEKINGAEALLRTIEAEGIDTIFGYLEAPSYLFTINSTTGRAT